MDRQSLFTRPQAPRLEVVISEAVLHRVAEAGELGAEHPSEAPARRPPDRYAVDRVTGVADWPTARRRSLTERPGYFKIYCPCADKHFKTIHITPNKAFLRDLVKWLNRETCWREDA
jgi:hypothetical protein